VNADDAELVLAAYRRWGADCVNHFLGDFAFAIWDAPRQRLFCARDHFGVRPFFYALNETRFAFASVLNVVRRFPGVGDHLDDLAVADFLLFDHNQDPRSTTFADVRRLEAAHCLEVSRTGMKTWRYWSLPAAVVRHRSAAECVAGFVDVLDRAVADRLTSRRASVMMSGGLDSTSVAATALRVRHGLELRAFATVYDRLIPDQERRYAGIAAAGLGIPISFGEADSCALFERFGELGDYFPEPAHEPHAATTVDLSRRASAHARIILTGWDGDAVLNDSPRHYLGWLAREGRFARAVFDAARYCVASRRIVPAAWSRSPAKPLRFPEWIQPDLCDRLGLRKRWSAFHEAGPSSAALRPAAEKALGYIAGRSNWFDGFHPACTGAVAEFRHPFLDLRVVEYCLSVPTYPWCIRKDLLRQAMRGCLPEAIRMRPKAALAGFPYLELLQRTESKWVDEFVACPATSRYVDRFRIPSARAEKDPNEAWALLRPLGLDIWLRQLQPLHSPTKERHHEFA